MHKRLHCNALQHTATPCNTHADCTASYTSECTATHCNTLQHTLQHTATHCNTPADCIESYSSERRFLCLKIVASGSEAIAARHSLKSWTLWKIICWRTTSTLMKFSHVSALLNLHLICKTYGTHIHTHTHTRMRATQFTFDIKDMWYTYSCIHTQLNMRLTHTHSCVCVCMSMCTICFAYQM